jgi:hypothetical protein
MRAIWLTTVLGLVCLTSLALIASADEIVFDQKIFDEKMDVYDFDGQPETKSFIDIEWVRARFYEPSEDVVFELHLVDGMDPSAVYTVGVTIDGLYSLTLRLDGEDNFTAFDERDGDLDVEGYKILGGSQLAWSFPLEDFNASTMVLIDWARAEHMVNGTARAWDTCEWDISDYEKGLVAMRIIYKLIGKDTIIREVDVTYHEEATTVFKYELDTNMDRYLSQDEIDTYRNQLETDPGYTHTDMSLNFHQHVTTTFEVDTFRIFPGPIFGGSTSNTVTVLTVTYPETDETPNEFRWELELQNMLMLPYWRATDNSYLRVELPKALGDIIKFDRESQSLLVQGFFGRNDTVFEMNGSEMRAHWNNTMVDHEGFSLKREKREDSGDGDDDSDGSWCPLSTMVIVFVPAFALVHGWMGRDRRPHPRTPPRT